MSARQAWMAGELRPVSFAADFADPEDAVEFLRQLGDDLDQSVEAYDHDGDTRWVAIARGHGHRDGLRAALAAWTRAARRAGGQARPVALVVFADDDLEFIDPRVRPLRRHGGRRHRRRRTRR